MARNIIQFLVFVIQLFFTISVLGSFTSWFRSDMDLIQTLSWLSILALFLVLLVPFHFYYLLRSIRKTGGRLEIRLLIISSFVFFFIVGGYNIAMFGRMYPPLEGRFIKDRPRTLIDSNGHVVEWWVEFVNPFHEKHKERLVLFNGSEKRCISMKLLERKGWFTYEADNIYLEQDGSNLLLKSEMEISPYTRYVLIDYKTGDVISNWLEEAIATPPRGAVGGGGSEEGNP